MTCKPSRSPPPGQDFSKGRVLSRVHTGWFCLDCKLMPWSAKARELLQRQYAPVGAAGVAALEAVIEGVIQSPPASGMADAYRHRLERLWKYREAYRRYCWPVSSLGDYKLAPFHLLASEGKVHSEKTSRWHMETLRGLAAADQLPRLRSRGVSGKRSLAAREFALGMEALERFVAREPLRRVHECVFGVLALERASRSAPVIAHQT